MIRLRQLVMEHLGVRDDERGVAMMTAILFMIIMAGVSTIILGVVTAQITPSYIAQKRTTTIYSAQAGIQATLSVMRAAGTVDGTGNTYGDPTKLPCSLSGTPNATADGNGYAVTISYYAVDPTPHATDAAWLASASNQISCNSGGVYGVTGHGPVSTPKFALITSAGTATQIPTTTGSRSITAVYQFKVSNVNIPGGLINNTGASACLQAVSATAGVAATAGSKIGWAASASCGQTQPNATNQLWTYTTSWQLALASTQVGGLPGLCITGSVAAPPATPSSNPATLQPCATDSTRWNQLWSWTGNYTWEGENSAISGPNGSAWLTPGVADGTSPIGKFLQVSQTVTGTLAPTSLVGAGGAQHGTSQLVNYQEFGRCADITNEQIGNSFMISYPCKQDPTGGTSYITWNQKWYYCEQVDTTVGGPCYHQDITGQQIYVYLSDNTSQKYCLTTPAVGSGSFYPYFTTCALSGTLHTQQTWDRIYNTGTFGTSYWMTDSQGRCLMADSTDLFSNSPVISKITVAGCDTQDDQKWNAVPTYVGGTIGGYRELSGG